MSFDVDAGPRGPGPILIGGLSGSGKTQLRQVLGAHPDISLTRRSYMWNRFYGRFGSLDDPANLERCLATMAADHDVQRLDPDWSDIRSELLGGPRSYARLIGLVHAQHARQLGKRRWGEQLRDVECFAEPIFAAFPTARMIHMVRDPRVVDRDTVRSTRARSGKFGWDLAVWLHSAEIAQQNRQRYPERYRVVRRENFEARPRETVEELCAFVGAEMAAPMLDELRAVRFPGSVLARNAPLVDFHAYRALSHLGYEPMSGSRRRVHGARALTSWPLDRATMTAWRVARGAPLMRRART